MNMVMAFTAPEGFVMNNLKDRLTFYRIRVFRFFSLLLFSFIGKASLTEEFIYHLIPGKIDQKIRYKNHINQIRCREERKSTLAQEAKFSRKEWSAAMVVTKSLDFEF